MVDISTKTCIILGLLIIHYSMSQEDKNLLIESYAKSREKALIKSYINDYDVLKDN